MCVIVGVSKDWIEWDQGVDSQTYLEDGETLEEFEV